jgi:hypothetical protein
MPHPAARKKRENDRNPQHDLRSPVLDISIGAPRPHPHRDDDLKPDPGPIHPGPQRFQAHFLSSRIFMQYTRDPMLRFSLYAIRRRRSRAAPLRRVAGNFNPPG